jgi:hypothetical protein
MLTANTAEMDVVMIEHLDDVRVGAQFAFRDIMRVFANSLVTLSFPKNAKEGREAIDQDTDKIFIPLDSPDVISYFETEFGDGTATKGGKLKGKKRRTSARRNLPRVKFNWDGNEARMRAWHESFRRRGRVVAKSSAVATIGQFVFYSGMYVTRAALRKYRRGRYVAVGKFKAGWEPAASALASMTAGRSTVPAFVKKQPVKRGGLIDKSGAKGLGDIVIINRTPYATKLGKFILGRARRKTNSYAMQATKKQAEDVVRRFNEQKARGAA